MEGNSVIVLDPVDSLAYSAAYTIVVTTDIADLQGLNLEKAYTARFHTEENQNPEWMIFNTSNSGLPSDEVTCVAVDTNNAIWIGTFPYLNGGVVSFDGNTWTRHDKIFNPSFADTIWAITVDNNNNIWTGSPMGRIAMFDGFTWTIYSSSNSGMIYNSAEAISKDQTTNIWIGTQSPGYNGSSDGGLVKYDGTNWTVFNSVNSGLPYAGISCITIDASNNKWIGTWDGLAVFDDSNWTVYNTSNSGLPHDRVNALSIDQSGDKWIGTSGGVAKFDGNNWTVYNTYNSGLPDNEISTIAIDQVGNIWIGTRNVGVVKYDGIDWRIYNASNSILTSYNISSIVVDKNNNIWIGMGWAGSWGGLAVYNENGVILH
jgi:ligand-binding sensor domain-containing protein